MPAAPLLYRYDRIPCVLPVWLEVHPGGIILPVRADNQPVQPHIHRHKNSRRRSIGTFHRFVVGCQYPHRRKGSPQKPCGPPGIPDATALNRQGYAWLRRFQKHPPHFLLQRVLSGNTAPPPHIHPVKNDYSPGHGRTGPDKTDHSGPHRSELLFPDCVAHLQNSERPSG